VEPPINPYPPLLSLAVHELRTPASVVGGYLRMLQKDQNPPMSERQLHMIDEAEKSCARLVAIVAELSEIGKLDSGVIRFAQRQFDLFSLLGELAELVHEGSDRNVQLKMVGPPEGAPMSGDPARLQTAFQAIFRAILREQAGPVTVVAERRHETVDGAPCAVVVVAIEGSVQEAYDRASGPFDDRRGGLGLALPLARRVIEGHGGRMRSPALASAASANADSLARSSVVISFPLGS
jgi:signal transduction histidine kinase